MTHVRQQVRALAKQALSGLSIDSRTLNTYTNRIKDLEPSNLPSCVILTEDERSERAGKSAALDRTISVLFVVVIDAESSATIDDDLDAWAEAIELRLAAAPPAARFTLTATNLDLPQPEEGQQWLGFMSLEYEAKVFGE